MLRTLIGTFLVSVGALPSLVSAQIVETFRTYAEPRTSEGNLTGCSLVFDGAMQDTLYSNGNLIAVSGSIIFNGYVQGNVNPALFVKLVVQDAAQSVDGIAFSPQVPNFVVPVGLNDTSLRGHFLKAVASETDGGWMGIYSIDALPPLLDRLVENELALAFNRAPGGTDLHFVANLRIGRQGQDDGGETSLEFMSCVQSLTNELRNSIAD